MIRFNFLLLVLLIVGCANSSQDQLEVNVTDNAQVEPVDTIEIVEEMYCNNQVQVGAERIDEYLELLKGKTIGIVGNQSSMVGESHLVDTLIALGIDVKRIFSPEHGFRGDADAGEKVNNEIDERTGVPIVSIYGNNKKPTNKQLEGIDIFLFDIQDVGVRFYTYISTLHYFMEAVAENNKQLIILDRPNPNGHYVDGPTLKEGYTSFIGMHKVPVVHGMTIGEYGQMINGENWLSSGLKCDLKVITCTGWDHTKFYELPIAPSPNLPNMAAVYLYPSLCFFEGTIVSIGRGTDYPFQIIGHPDYILDSNAVNYSFVPKPNVGAKHPKLENKSCFGFDLHEVDLKEFRKKGKLDMQYLIDFYANLDRSDFFLANNFINLLAGSSELKKAIIGETDLEELTSSWQEDKESFLIVRENYLLYKDILLAD